MAAQDAALLVPAAVTHVVLPGLARVTTTRPPHGCHDEIAGLESLDLPANILDDPEVLVTKDEVLIPCRSLAEKTVLDLGIRTAKARADHLHGDLIRLQLRIGHVAHVNGAFDARLDDDGLHSWYSGRT